MGPGADKAAHMRIHDLVYGVFMLSFVRRFWLSFHFYVVSF